MPLVPVALSNKTNPARYKQGGAAQLLNAYVEQTGEEGKTNWAIYAIDGLQAFAKVNDTGGVRALLTVDGYVYFVTTKNLWRSDTLGNTILLGTLDDISATGPVYMERNRKTDPDIAIVSGGAMYYYNKNNTPTLVKKVTSPGPTTPTSLSFVDGYFITTNGKNIWEISPLDNSINWDPNDYGRGDANPDNIVRVAAMQRDAVIFGEVSTEFWRNTGAVDFPFERVATNEFGCLSPDSALITMQGLTWIAHDRTVRVLNGYEGQRISTHAVERDIQSVTDPENIRAATWTAAGHSFYSISSSSWTWVYDSTTNLWHTRKSTINGEDVPYWRVIKVEELAGMYIAGDRNTATLYKMDSEYLKEDLDPIKVKVTLPPVHNYPKRITINSFHVDMEKGVGLSATGDVEDQNPAVILRWSLDGGYTFNAQRSLSLGKQGARTQRIRTHRLGQSSPDGFVFQLEAPSKTIRAIYQCMADVDSE